MSKKGTPNPILVKEKIIYFLLLILLVSLPLGGLYNNNYSLAFGLIFGVLFLFFLKSIKSNIDIFEFTLLILVLFYSISLVNAADYRSASIQLLKQIFYLLFYITLKNIDFNEGLLVKIFSAIYLSISSLTIITFLAKGELIPLKSYIIAERFSSSLGYANTYALLLVISFVIGIQLPLHFKINKAYYYLNNFLLILNIIALYSTKSRGGFLIYIVAIVLIHLFNMNYYRRMSPLVFYINLMAILILFFTLKLSGFLFLIFVNILASLAVLLMYLSKEKLKLDYLSSIKYLNLFIYLSLITGSLYLFFTTEIFERLVSYDFNATDVFSRVYFYMDGLRIFFDNFLIGTGGGGWLALYSKYQSHAYFTLEAHSYIIQLLIEIGLLAIPYLLVLGYLLVWYTIQKFKKNTKWHSDLAFICFLFILVHSSIDFNMSFPAVVLISLVFVSFLKPPIVQQLINIKIIKYYKHLVICFTIFMIILSSGIFLGKLYIKDFTKAAKTKDVSISKIVELEKQVSTATFFDPLNAEYYGYLGQLNLMLAKIENSDEKIQKGLQYMGKSIEIQPYRSDVYFVRGQVLNDLGREAEALEDIYKAIENAPLKNDSYDFLMEFYVTKGTSTKEKEYFMKAQGIIKNLRIKMNEISEDRKERWIGDYLGYSINQCYYAGISSYILGDYLNGVNYFKDIFNSGKTAGFDDKIIEEVKVWVVYGEKKLNKQESFEVSKEELIQITKKLSFMEGN